MCSSFRKALRKTCISHSAPLFLAKADASIFHACQLFLDKQLRAIVVDANNSIRCRIVGNDLPCNQRLQLLLDQPFQRTCTIVDIVSLVDDIFLGCLRYFQIQLFFLQPLFQLLKQQVYNPENL